MHVSTPPPLARAGGIAALVCAGTYLFGFALLLGPLAAAGYGSSGADPAAVVEFIAGNGVLMSAWFLVIYVLNGLALAVLALALERRAAAAAPGLARIVGAVGLIWATLVIGAGMAANVGVRVVADLYPQDPEAAILRWDMVELIENGIGGGNEILGGVLALLVALAALRFGVLPRLPGLLAALIGLAGLATVFTPLEPLAAPVFGLGYIAWFIWTGIVLLTSPAPE